MLDHIVMRIKKVNCEKELLNGVGLIHDRGHCDVFSGKLLNSCIAFYTQLTV